MNDAIVHFTIGSSPIVTIFPFMILYSAYGKLTEDEKDESKLSFASLAVGLPIASGIVFALLYNSLGGIIPRKVQNKLYLRFVVCGALTTVVLSLVLHYVFHIHEDWLEIQNPLFSHILVLLFYLLLYFTIGQWLRGQLLYGPQKPSTSSSSGSSSGSGSSSSPPVSTSAVSTTSSSGGGKSSAVFDALANKASGK
jgi:drug/metabolite transporter (DMT)-like permease